MTKTADLTACNGTTTNSQKPSTTTISTIAINAGDKATIVVALLKSIGYASLRIDEMRPRMLELGENAEESSALLAIHDDLMKKLKSKENQVEELLARADHLVTQQKEPDVYVYEAMAENLGSAWKELNRQLLMRGFLLAETVRFHQLANRHEKVSLDVRNILQQTIHRPNSSDLNDTVQRIQQLFNELIDVTASAVDSGADLITHIRVLGAMADNVESVQETAEACLLIEKIMLKMAAEWEVLEETWKNERCKLEMQIDESGTILAHIEEIESWLRNGRIQLNDAQNINTLMQQTLKERKSLSDIISMIEQSKSNVNLRGRTRKLQSDLDQFMQEIKQKKDENDKIIAWTAAANAMLNQLGAMEMDMRNANAAMANELAPLARQKAQTVIEDGQKLAHLDHRVNRFIADIRNKLKEIEDLASERIDESKGLLKDQLFRFEKWLTKTEQDLTTCTRLGSNFNEANQFHQIHKSIVTEIISRNSELNALCSKFHELNETDRKRLEKLKHRYESLKETVDTRLNLCTAFQQVHKFAKELESSFESLSALINNNCSYMNEKLLVQMKEVFRMIEETIKQERHQGEKFIETAQLMASKDPKLSIEESVNSVRNVLNEHEQRHIKMQETWQQWQQNRMQQQKVIRIVEEVQMWQEETIEIIRMIEKKLSEARIVEEREEVRKTVEELKERFLEQNKRMEEVEQILEKTKNEEAVGKILATKKRQAEIKRRMDDIWRRIETEKEIIIHEETMKFTKAPEILSHLHDAQVDEGSRFEFSARIESEPISDVQWFKDGRCVKDNMDYRTAFINGIATLTIDETFIEDTAVYTVRAENSAGVAESSAKLVVKSRSEMESQLEEQFKPRFVRQLRNIGITEGEDVLLDCVIVAVPEPKIVWYKDGIAIKESEHIELRFEGDHCSLIIKNASLSDAGLYTVKANNVVGEATNFCRLSVKPVEIAQEVVVPTGMPSKSPVLLVAPSFDPPLINQIVQKGSKAIFEVRVFAKPSVMVHWKFNDKPLHESREIRIEKEMNGWHRVIIENVYPEHSGMYTVIAENEAGEARSGATLNVKSLEIPLEKKDRVVIRNMSEGFWSDSALMSSPTPPPVPRHRYSETEEFMEKHLTEYACSPTATTPEFIRPFQNEYVISEGKKFKIDCLLIGNPRPKVQWFFNDQIINVNSKFCTISNFGDTYSMILNPARLDHTGAYKMTAENIRGKTESVFTVRVLQRSLKPSSVEHIQITEEYGSYEFEQIVPDERFSLQDEEQRRLAAKQHPTRLLTPPPAKKQQLLTTHHQKQLSDEYETEESRVIARPPHFIQTLVSAVATCGDNATFQGIVTGWPTPEVSWTKNGIPLSKSTNPDLTFSNIGGRVSLSFFDAKLEHAGKYMCTAKNTSGVATSSAQLVVRPRTIAPDFIRRLISEEVEEGDELKWSVHVTGDPVPKITWLRDGVIIPNCNEVQLIDEGNGVHSIIIVKVELADSGQFTCLAENIAGEARSTADLVVRPAGSQPGSYFHVTKVTQEKQMKGEEVNRNESCAIENPRSMSESK
ncbi:unnamed protein product [Thelazia callipaeda]|uniref:Ig-like domain-containing protein n=1 Tax=Thelazia callipaeda TaxID=103827 RepID=A0A0N5D5G8_THECL|nr:unnamed protein product [Thelazia callipaeda]